MKGKKIFLKKLFKMVGTCVVHSHPVYEHGISIIQNVYVDGMGI
jgi:hypothetical protein